MPTPNADDPLRTTDHDPAAQPQAPPETVTAESPLVPQTGEAAPTPTGKATLALPPEQVLTREGSPAATAEPPLPAIPGYQIEGVLGRGGMGVVYKARHLALKRTVALKMVLAGGHAGPRELARFRIEAEAVARLQHANIVQIHEVGEADGHPYCELEYVPGGSLAGKLDGQPMLPREAARLVETLARAMQLAHSRNVVHRDLKPANVLLTEDGTPKITDFGLARHLDSDSGQTQSGMVMGTPSYMAPEQAAGNSREVGPAADIYALGAILYECLTGRPPFRGASTLETLRQVLNDEPVPPTQLQPKVPRDLETVCLKCLHKEGARRYESPAALADDLRCFLDGRPIVARPVGGVERALKWARRRPALAALLAVSLAAVVAVAVFSVALFNSNKDLEANNDRLDQANVQLVQQKNVADEARKEAEKNGKEADDQRKKVLEKSAELQQRVEQLRVFLFTGQVQKAIALAESDPRLALNALLDQRLCLPWLRDFVWGATYRRARAYQALPMGTNQGSLDLSADGKRLAFWGSRDPGVRLVELPSGRDCTPKWDAFARDDGLEGAVLHRAIALSPDGKLLAVGLRRVEQPFGGFGMGGFGRRPNPDAKPLSPGALHIWDTGTGRKHRTLARAVGVDVVAFSRDGRSLAATVRAADKIEIKVWDVATGKETQSIDPHGFGSTLAFSADGQKLIAGKVVPIEFACWSTASGERRWTCRLPTQAIGDLSMSVSPDGRRLAAHLVGRPGVWLLDASNGNLLSTLEQPGDPGEQIATFFQTAYSKGFGMSALPSATHGCTLGFSSDGKVLAAVSPAGVQVWDVTGGQTLRRTEVLARSLAFLPGGRTLALAASSTTGLRADSLATRLALWDVLYQPGRVAAEGMVVKAVDPRGRRLVGSTPGATGPRMVGLDGQGRVAGLPLSLTHSAFSPDGSTLAGTWVETIQEVYPIGSTSPHAAGRASGAGGKTYLVPGGKLLLREEQRTPKEGGLGMAYEVVEVDSGKTVSQLFLEGEVQPVGGAMVARCSPDGKYLALPSWGPEGSLRIWHMPSGKLLYRLPGQNNVVFAPRGRVAAACSLTFATVARGKVDLTFFDVETGRTVGTVADADIRRPGPSPAIGEPFGFSRDGSVFAFLRDRKIVLWDVKKKAEAGLLEGHAATVAGLFVPAGGGLISVDEGGTWKRWDLEARKEVATGKQEGGRVARLALSPDGKHMATASGTGIHLWDTTTGQRLRTIRDDRAARGELEFISGGRRLMAWGSRRLWDVASGKEPGSYRNSPPRPFLSVAYTSDGRSLLAVTAPPVQGTSWPEEPDEVRSLTALSLPPGAAAAVHDAATGKQCFGIAPRDVPSVFTADGRFLVGPLIAAEIDAPVNEVYWFPQNQLVRELVVTDAATGKVVLRVPCPQGDGGQVWLPADGKTLALAIHGRALQLWDLDTKQLRGSIPAQRVWNVRVSPAGNVLATFGERTQLWDMATGKSWASLGEAQGFPVGFTADGKLLATNIPRPGGNEIALWDLRAGRKLAPPQGRAPVIVRSVVAGDGRAVLLYPARPRDRFVLWDFQRGRVSEIPEGVSAGQDAPPRFSPDGRLLALSGTSKADPRSPLPAACVVEIDSGKVLLDLPGILPVCFLAGGRTLLVGRSGWAIGSTVRLIETATGRSLQTFPGTLQVPQWSSRLVQFQRQGEPRTCPAPDGQTLIHTTGGVVQIYDALTGRLRGTFQGEAERLPIQGVSADGKTLALKTVERRPGSSPGSVIHVPVLRLWDADTGEERPGPRGPFDTLDIGTDRRTLRLQRSVRHLSLWDAGTGKERRALEGISGWVTDLAWSPDGRSVVTVSHVPDPNRAPPNNGVTQIWDTAGGKELCRFDSDQGTAALSPDGRLVAVTTTVGEKRVQIWAADGGRLRHTFAGAERGLFAEGGRRFVTAGATGLTVWDLSSGKERHKLLAGEHVADMQVTADGKGLLTLSSQSSAEGVSWRLTLLELAGGREQAGFNPPVLGDRNGVLLKAAWTPDGRTAAVLSNAGKTVSVFDMLTGQEQLVLTVPLAAPASANPGRGPGGRPDAGAPFNQETRLAFADGGKRLLVGLADGRVVAWDTQWPEPAVAESLSGFWKAEGREVVQELAAGGALLFGDPEWADYDAEVELSPSGAGLVGLAVLDRGFGAVEALVHSSSDGKSGFWEQDAGANNELKCRQEASGMKEALVPGRWYRVKVSVRGSHVTLMLDGKTLCEYRPPRARGRVGLVSHGTAARFRKVRVTHAHEVVLWDGLPQPPPPPPERLAAVHRQAGERLLAEGKLNEALAEFRLGLRMDPNNAPALRQAGFLLARLGRREEALDLLRQLSPDPSLTPLLQELRRGFIAEKLSEFVAGKRKARDEQEKVILCSLCAANDYPLAGARLYRELFAEYPWYQGAGGLPDHDREPYRANAARAAARAGTGQGKDAGALPEEDRRAWRRQARAWLETELHLQTRLGNDGSLHTVPLRQLLRGWQRDPGFADVRGEALARLPADERTSWRKLWAEIDGWQQTAIALSYGAWRAEPGGLAQDQTFGEYVWLVGEPSWTDVTVEVEVQGRDGGGELGVLVRAREADDTVRAVLDGWGHTAQGIITLSPGQGGINLGSTQAAALEPNRWYRVRVEAHGQRFRMFVDDRQVVDAREQGFSSGRIGLFTLYRAARFRGFKVTDPRGRVLFQGVKPAPDGNEHDARAQALHRRGRPGEAIPLYVEALKHHPDDPAAVFRRLGQAHEELGQAVQALLASRKAQP